MCVCVHYVQCLIIAAQRLFVHTTASEQFQSCCVRKFQNIGHKNFNAKNGLQSITQVRAPPFQKYSPLAHVRFASNALDYNIDVVKTWMTKNKNVLIKNLAK